MFILIVYSGMHNSKIDYEIELDQEHGVIINGDTIELNDLEEYIVQDNV